MRSRVSNARRFTFFLLFLSLYIMIKLLIITNDDQGSESNPSKGFHEAGINPSAPTVSLLEALGTTVSLRNLYSEGSNCSTEYLGAPNYVKSIGCSGLNARFCKILTCKNLLLGTDAKVYDLAHEFMAKYQKAFQTNTEIGKAAEDCDSFRRSRGYRMEPASTEDALFPIAFNILVHTNVGQLERLLRAIYRPQHSYCIHVDRKSSPDLINAVAKITECFENVFIATKLENIVYAGFTRLRADLNCMEDHVRRTSVQWKYLLNTAAQSFPLQTPEDMVRILKIYNGSNDIEGIHGPRVIRYRFESEWEERTETMSVNQTGKANKPAPHDLDIVRGSAFGAFSRKFVEFLLSDRRSLDLLEWSKKTYSPDEHFWATLHHTYTNPHLRTPGGYSGPPNEKPWLAVFVKWGGLPSGCHGKFVRGVCILGIADLPDLISRKEFFVNKFYEDFQPLGLDCLEAWIKQKEECPVPFDHEFYQKLPFVKRY